jgi:hypothetical protein
MTSRIDSAEGEDDADCSQENSRVASPRPLSLERSPSKREFLKSVLLAGVAANLVLALPGGVNASPLRILSSNSSSATTAKPSALNLSRVFRFNDPKTGAPQISAFPEVDPTGDTPLEIRMKHFTEIENFTFIGFVLAHETGGNNPRPISTITSLVVPDTEFQNLVNLAKTDKLTDEQLGDTLLDVGINWEHFVASNNTLLIPAMPTKITDTAMQAKIDALDLITEALVAEVNLRSLHGRRGSRDGGTQGNA